MTENLSGEDWAAEVEENPWPSGEFSEGHDLAVEDYDPNFDRLSTERRVLGFISDEDHLGRPRNTVEVLAEDMRDDPNSDHAGDVEEMQEYLDSLEGVGLVAKRDDETYEVTEAGRVELAN